MTGIQLVRVDDTTASRLAYVLGIANGQGKGAIAAAIPTLSAMYDEGVTTPQSLQDSVRVYFRKDGTTAQYRGALAFIWGAYAHQQLNADEPICSSEDAETYGKLFTSPAKRIWFTSMVRSGKQALDAVISSSEAVKAANAEAREAAKASAPAVKERLNAEANNLRALGFTNDDIFEMLLGESVTVDA